MRVSLMIILKRSLLGVLVVMSILNEPLYAQERFVYRDFDKTVLEYWLAEGNDVQDYDLLLNGMEDAWRVIEGKIYWMDFLHFDNVGFVRDQQVRVKQIIDLSARQKIRRAKEEAYVLLTEFKEVRECFTTDDYDLDHMIGAYDTYRAVHKIIHDPQMGLYEWNEFVWHVDRLKCAVEELEQRFRDRKILLENVDIGNALDRLNICLTTLDESLGDAYRPDFEIPCNDLNIAFKGLFKAYIDKVVI